MLQVICGFVVGLLLAGLGFGLVGGGVPGLIVAVVLAALGYIAASTLTEPERRIGKMLVSALPNGQKTADTIDAANAQLNSIAMLTKQVRDPAVKAEANDFIAATKDLINEQSKHTPGWLLIDTPLHGFDEGIRPLEDSSMKVGLFSYLAKQAVSQQIIIIENTNHMAGIPLDDNINIVEFSKDKHNGRYGYLDGIYDVSDES